MLTYSLVWYTKTRKLFNISFMPSCSSQLWLQGEKKSGKVTPHCYDGRVRSNDGYLGGETKGDYYPFSLLWLQYEF